MAWNIQKQLSSGFLKKRCSENMQQIYRGTSMPKCDFNKVAEQHLWIAVSEYWCLKGKLQKWNKRKFINIQTYYYFLFRHVRKVEFYDEKDIKIREKVKDLR